MMWRETEELHLESLPNLASQDTVQIDQVMIVEDVNLRFTLEPQLYVTAMASEGFYVMLVRNL